MLDRLNYDVQLLVLQSIDGTPAEKQATLAATAIVCKKLLAICRTALYSGPHLRTLASANLFRRTIELESFQLLKQRVQTLYYYPEFTRDSAPSDSVELVTLQCTSHGNILVDKTCKVDALDTPWVDTADVTLHSLPQLKSLHIGTPSYQDLTILLGQRVSLMQLSALTVYSASANAAQSHVAMVLRACIALPLLYMSAFETDIVEFEELDELDYVVADAEVSEPTGHLSASIRELHISRPLWPVLGTMYEIASLPASLRVLHIEMASCLEEHVGEALERLAGQLEELKISIMGFSLDPPDTNVPQVSALLSGMSNLRRLIICSEHLPTSQLESLPPNLRHLHIADYILDSFREKVVAGPAQFAELINTSTFPTLETFTFTPNCGFLGYMKQMCAGDHKVPFHWAYFTLFEFMDDQKRLETACEGKGIKLISDVGRELVDIHVQTIEAHIDQEGPEAAASWMADLDAEIAADKASDEAKKKDEEQMSSQRDLD